jgi:hypothetical protein
MNVGSVIIRINNFFPGPLGAPTSRACPSSSFHSFLQLIGGGGLPDGGVSRMEACKVIMPLRLFLIRTPPEAPPPPYLLTHFHFLAHPASQVARPGYLSI